MHTVEFPFHAHYFVLLPLLLAFIISLQRTIKNILFPFNSAFIPFSFLPLFRFSVSFIIFSPTFSLTCFFLSFALFFLFVLNVILLFLYSIYLCCVFYFLFVPFVIFTRFFLSFLFFSSFSFILSFSLFFVIFSVSHLFPRVSFLLSLSSSDPLIYSLLSIFPFYPSLSTHYFFFCLKFSHPSRLFSFSFLSYSSSSSSFLFFFFPSLSFLISSLLPFPLGSFLFLLDSSFHPLFFPSCLLLLLLLLLSFPFSSFSSPSLTSQTPETRHFMLTASLSSLSSVHAGRPLKNEARKKKKRPSTYPGHCTYKIARGGVPMHVQ